MRRITSSYYDYYYKCLRINQKVDSLFYQESHNLFEFDELKSFYPEILLKALCNFNNNISNFEYYLLKCVQYYIKKWRHKQRRKIESLENYLCVAPIETSFSEYMELLDPYCRQLLEMIFVERKTFREINTDLGISCGTICNYVRNSLRILRKKLKSYDQ